MKLKDIDISKIPVRLTLSMFVLYKSKKKKKTNQNIINPSWSPARIQETSFNNSNNSVSQTYFCLLSYLPSRPLVRSKCPTLHRTLNWFCHCLSNCFFCHVCYWGFKKLAIVFLLSLSESVCWRWEMILPFLQLAETYFNTSPCVFESAFWN